jgi:hypothetical protein
VEDRWRFCAGGTSYLARHKQRQIKARGSLGAAGPNADCLVARAALVGRCLSAVLVLARPESRAELFPWCRIMSWAWRSRPLGGPGHLVLRLARATMRAGPPRGDRSFPSTSTTVVTSTSFLRYNRISIQSHPCCPRGRRRGTGLHVVRRLGTTAVVALLGVSGDMRLAGARVAATWCRTSSATACPCCSHCRSRGNNVKARPVLDKASKLLPLTSAFSK